MRYASAVVVLLVCMWLVAAPAGQEEASLVVDGAALANETQGDHWLGFGRTYSEQRFSPLTQIDTSNVQDLSVDWYLELPDERSLVSTPLVVDGVLYFSGSMSVVRAVNAVTGEILWEYDPGVAAHAATRMRAGWNVNRGVAYWKGRIYVATWDGRLVAVDGTSGREVWSTQTIDPDVAFYITGAPKVFRDKVLIGNGGTEHGAARGYVTAYDAETGEQAWRFHIVPGNPADGFENDTMAMAAETWTGTWWEFGGGGNAWHAFTYDPEFDAVYIGTGNGSPWNQKIRSPEGGDNLFLCAIVALDPDTGEYRWHYQTTPGDTWDFTSTMDMVLADLTIDEREVKALMHAPKNGFFYVIDRADGRLVSAEPFTEVTWATHVDLETGRPVEAPGARYEEGRATIAPSPIGGHSWHAMSYNPRTGLVYLPTIHQASTFTDQGIDLGAWRSPEWNMAVGVGIAKLDVARTDGAFGSLQAWDPVRQRQVWEIPLGGTWNAGTLTTAGNLVFQGRADGIFVAYHAETGEEVWTSQLGLGISAPPITYAVGGRQYVAILVGWGGVGAGFGGLGAEHGWAYGVHTRRLVAFSLEGDVELPPLPPPTVPEPIEAPGFEVDAGLVQQGAADFGDLVELEGRCTACHGGGAIAAGLAPDLRASPAVLSAEAFENIVRGGTRAARGMPGFPELTDGELIALRHYIRSQAEAALAAAGR